MTSCYNYRSIGLLQENNSTLPKYAKQDFQAYKIQVNDELIYRLVTSDETISKLITTGTAANSQNALTYRVYPDGTVDFPFIKSVKVEGLTLPEATDVIEKRFREIIPDAMVKLSLANKTFTVIGEAGSGVYPINREKFTIYQALSMFGELNHTGDFHHVRILRENGLKTDVMEFDIRPATLVESKYYYIYPNDIIYVQRSSSSFFKIENTWSNFMSIVSSSITLLATVLYYGSH